MPTITAECDAGLTEAINVGLQDGTVVIGEEITTAAVGIARSSNKECCHLLSSYRPAGAELIIGRRVAAPGDPGGADCFEIALMDVAVVIDERVSRSRCCHGRRRYGQQHCTTEDHPEEILGHLTSMAIPGY